MASKKPTPTQPEYEFHPLASAFKLLKGGEYYELVEDIRAHGLLEPIVLHEGKILDGRNRYLACLAAGIEPTFRPFLGDDPAAFVESANAHRRHLTPGAKRAGLEALIKLRPEVSDRQIAEQTGFSNTHVGQVRREMEAAGRVNPVDTSTDTRGRKQPRQRQKSKSAKRSEKPADLLPQVSDEVLQQRAASAERLRALLGKSEPGDGGSASTTESAKLPETRDDRLIREGEEAATAYLAGTHQAAVSGSVAVDALHAQIDRLIEERARLTSEVKKLWTAHKPKLALEGGEESFHCSFCAKSQHEVRYLVAGGTVFICNECVELCAAVIREQDERKSQAGVGPEPPPPADVPASVSVKPLEETSSPAAAATEPPDVGLDIPPSLRRTVH